MNLIGFGIMVVAMLLLMFTHLDIFTPLLLIGLVLFVSFPTEEMFCDYIMANSEQALVRKRHYILFLPVAIVTKILTLGKSYLLIPYKEEYYLAHNCLHTEEIPVSETDSADQMAGYEQISRKEYKALLNEQREIYSTQTLDKAFMERSYTVQSIGLRHKKRRLIAAIVLASITAVLLFDPDPMVWAMVAIYEVVFIPMALLWIAPYRDAKILQAAYNRAMQQGD